MNFEIKTIVEFEKQFKQLFKKYPSLKTDLLQLINKLEKNPFIGVALGNDFYKIRMGISSKRSGKSGGARIITCVKVSKKMVYLAAIYDKSAQAAISEQELKILAKQIA